MAKEDELLSVAKAAEIAGYEVSALRRVIRSGHLHAQQVGRPWIILRGDLENWMASEHYHPGGGRPRKKT